MKPRTLASLAAYALLAAPAGCGGRSPVTPPSDAPAPSATSASVTWMPIVTERPRGLLISTMSGPDGPDVGWLRRAFGDAKAGLPHDADEPTTSATFSRACEAAADRPAPLRAGAPAQIVTPAGVQPATIGACVGREEGAEFVGTLALDREPAAGPALGGVGDPLPAGTRLVAATSVATPERLAALRADLVAALPEKARRHLPAQLGAPGVQILAAPLGRGHTAVAQIAIDVPEDLELIDGLSLLALLGADGHVRAWLWSSISGLAAALPTLDGIKPEDDFGRMTVLGTLVSGGRAALYVHQTAIGDDFYELIWMDLAGPRRQRIYELMIE